jgi:hypothetical protein
MLLVLVMVFNLVPTTALATNDVNTSSSVEDSGSVDHPVMYPLTSVGWGYFCDFYAILQKKLK